MRLPSDPANYSQRLGFIKTQDTKHDLNASGSKTSNARSKVSLHAIPLEKGSYSFKRSILDSPNNTKYRQLSAPQILPHKTTNKISMSGYNFFLEIRGSGNLEK